MYELRLSDFTRVPITGLVVTGVLYDRDRIELRLADGRILTGVPYGDCCSDTWFEHVTVPPDVAGGVLMDVVDGEGVEVPHPDHECLRIYQTSVRTTRGEVIIEYRNSSNGYYGGNIEWEVRR